MSFCLRAFASLRCIAMVRWICINLRYLRFLRCDGAVQFRIPNSEFARLSEAGRFMMAYPLLGDINEFGTSHHDCHQI